MLSIPLQHHGLQLFRPPYRECTPIDPNAHPGETEPGHAAVWFMSPEGAVEEELRWSALRPASLPLFVVLPPPALVPDLADALQALPDLRPRGVLPGVGRGTLVALRTLLAAPVHSPLRVIVRPRRCEIGSARPARPSRGCSAECSAGRRSPRDLPAPVSHERLG